MSKLSRYAVMCVGAVAVLGTVTACSGDESTASAPITSAPVRTTSMYSSSSGTPSSVSSPQSEDLASAAESASAGSASKEPGLPATAPENHGGGGGKDPDGKPLDDKTKGYLQALKQQRVDFSGDADNTIAITAAKYVCAQQHKHADPTTIKAFVTALIGPSAKNEADANAKADKVIAAAGQHYC